MTNEQSEKIFKLRLSGYGYRTIAKEVGLPTNTVKSWCSRHPLDDNNTCNCLNCGKTITSIPHKRLRKYCSDECRFEWWKTHPEMRRQKSAYVHTCLFCGKAFKNNRLKADYCCRECFAKARRKAV